MIEFKDLITRPDRSCGPQPLILCVSTFQAANASLLDLQMNMFYFFLLVSEDSNTNTVPQDLAVSVIENTQTFTTLMKNAVNSC